VRQFFPTHTGIPFLGFRVYPTHRHVKSRKVIRFRRKLHHRLWAYTQGKQPLDQFDASIQGWINHVRYADTWGLRRSILNFTIPNPTR
ncbi:MAG: hypothetical protein MUO62_00295, partial [Anaerolineales bacterium]|nr:hypothetical protein [Anaerolineales bacterium]